MPFDYLIANAGEFTSRSDTEDGNSEGYVVYNTDTNEQRAVYLTEQEAKDSCAELNRKEQAGEL